MTSSAMIAGMLPMALGLGEAGQQNAPLGRAVIGGLAAAKAMARADVRVTLVDRHNYHLFQPLLYQVATATLSAGDIGAPIRWVLRRASNVRVLLGEAKGIDVASRTVQLADGAVLDYDYLIVATGARHAYFGHPEWETFAPGLKSLDDAQKIRRKILLAFEQAEKAELPARKKELLTFVLIGAGPTGVELAGAISEIVKEGLADFRQIDRTLVEVILIEAGDKALAGFPARIRDYTITTLRKRGVKVLLNSAVRDIT